MIEQVTDPRRKRESNLRVCRCPSGRVTTRLARRSAGELGVVLALQCDISAMHLALFKQDSAPCETPGWPSGVATASRVRDGKPHPAILDQVIPVL